MLGRSPRGVILLLVSGVVVLLLLFAVALLGLARTSTDFARGAMGAAAARLAASGGMEYAAARLQADPFPGAADVASARGDDWTEREGSGTSGQGSENPSYSHGEGWIEGGAPDGKWAAGEVAGPDLDSDGHLSAWSGRLRGAGGPFALRFSLRVDAKDGKIPVNAGLLSLADGIDGDGDGSVDEPDEADLDGGGGWDYYAEPNGVPDHRDLGVPYHRGLARALDGLGAVLGIASSTLGQDLIANRPAGGYRHLDAVRAALKALGYPAGDVAKVEPFIDPGPYEDMGESGRGRDNQVFSFPRYVPVRFWSASREVLEAIWRDQVCPSPRRGFAPSSFSPGKVSNDFLAEPAGWSLACPHGGSFGGADLRIWPEEAGALAELAVRLRKTGKVSWGSLRREILTAALPGAPTPLFALEGEALSGFPSLQRSWLAMKADLAYQVVTVDPYPYRGQYDSLAHWGDGGMDLDNDPANGIQHSPLVGFPLIGQTTALGVSIRPEGLTLAPPRSFSVSSFGWAGGRGGQAPARASCDGSLSVSTTLELASQEDFERLAEPYFLRKRGIYVLDLPSPSVRHDTSSNEGPKIVSLPRYNRRSLKSDTDALSTDPAKGALCGFSRTYGALALGSVEAGLQTSWLYWPLIEDFDRQENTAAKPLWKELWSVNDPAFTNAFLPLPYRMAFPSVAGYRLLYNKRRMVGGFPGYEERPDQMGPHSFCGGRRQFKAPWDAGNFGLNGPINAATIEAWIGPESRIDLGNTDFGGCRLTLISRRENRLAPPSDRQGTAFELRIQWPSGNVNAVITSGPVSWFVPDPPTGPRASTAYHVVLTFSKIPSGIASPDPFWTHICLYVNGSNASEGGPMQHDHHQVVFGSDMGSMGNLGIYCLTFVGGGADEIRFYKTVLDESAARARYRLGRYQAKGTYASPLYVPDVPSRLLECQWSGIVPAGLGVDPFTVTVEGFSDAAGSASMGAFPLIAPAGEAKDLRALFPRPVRSFRYLVTIDCTGASGVLDETPLFESIWFTFQRKGIAPAWSAWTSR